MNKSEFLHILRQRLSPLPAEEREQHIAYYEELFSDMLEEGMRKRLPPTWEIRTPSRRRSWRSSPCPGW